MRQITRLSLISAGLALGVSALASGGIGPGSPAPKLDVKTWYKGTPVKQLDPNKTYVVEFWATWCGPCIQTIPHVTELAKKNKDVTFIGVSIWEEDEGTKIKDFVAKMGDKMDYNVGYSGNQTGMSQSWMEAAAQNGIPSAFIVKNGTIQWIGHPMNMDKPLAEVKAGTFDLKAFKVQFDKEAEATRAQMAARAEMTAASKLITEGKFAEAKTKIDALEKQYPTMKASLDNLRFSMLAKQDPAAWDAKAKQMAASKNQMQLQALIAFAMNQTRAGGDVALGTKAMDYALDAAEENDLLTFYNGASFFNAIKEYKKALVWADKAVAAIPTSQFKDNEQAKTAIKKLRDDVAAKANAG